MSYDAPKLGGYQFVNPPDIMNFAPVVIQQVNELADGGSTQRLLGYKFKAELLWNNNWIKEVDYTGIIGVANDITGTLSFYPKPNSKSSLVFTVIWTNRVEFSFHNGNFGTWGGSIQLETPYTTSVLSTLP